MRQSVLLKKTIFEACQCERCKDPTELGTFASGIYCPHCPKKEGLLLSENPLNPEADWVCNKCSKRKPLSFIANVLDIVGPEWTVLNRESVSECEQFIEKYSEILHPYHYFLTDVKLSLCCKYGKSQGETSITNPNGIFIIFIIDILRSY